MKRHPPSVPPPPDGDRFGLGPSRERVMAVVRRRLNLAALAVLLELVVVYLVLWYPDAIAPPAERPDVAFAVRGALWMGVVLVILAGTAIEDRLLERGPKSTGSPWPVAPAWAQRAGWYFRVKVGLLATRGLAGLTALWLGLSSTAKPAYAYAMVLALVLDHLLSWPRTSVQAAYVRGEGED